MTSAAVELAYNATARTAFFDNVNKAIVIYGWDGFAIDLEGPTGR